LMRMASRIAPSSRSLTRPSSMAWYMVGHRRARGCAHHPCRVRSP
jgi:hypothetical protein